MCVTDGLIHTNNKIMLWFCQLQIYSNSHLDSMLWYLYQVFREYDQAVRILA